MKNRILQILILAIFSVGFYFLGWYSHKPVPVKPTVPFEYAPDLSSMEPYIPFTRDECPETNTAENQACITELADATIADADILANKLLQATPNMNRLDVEYYGDIRAYVRAVQKTKDSYMDAFCGLDTMLIYGGSGMQMEMEACRYYHTLQYLNLLKNLEKSKNPMR